MKKKIVELLLQIIPVMIGVYLGFVVSDWSDNQKTEAKTEVMLKNIRAEIDSNRVKLADVLDYHIMLRDSCRYYASNAEPDIKKARFFNGLRNFPLAGSAYQTGIQTGLLNELALEHLQFLNQIYHTQEFYNNFSNIMLTGIISKNYTQDENSVRNMMRDIAMFMTDIVIQEQKLLQYYAQELESVKVK